MSAEIIFMMIIGHFVGDYFFQNNWMALNKKNNYLICIAHCLTYGGCMSFCLAFASPPHASYIKVLFIIMIIALTHFIFDYTNIIDKYLELIEGRSWKSALEQHISKEGQIYIGYTILVQTVIDNTSHIICNYIILKIFL
jgi:hypothetical protein